MKKWTFLIASLLMTNFLWAQSPKEKGLNAITRLNAEAYVGFLANDLLEGREAGFRGGQIAGNYIVS